MDNCPFIDLHIHSNCSDGKKSIEEILNICSENNVKTIAFAEHYNMGSYKKARRLAEPYGIEIIPAIEIGASLLEFGFSNHHICHIVAYYPSYKICKILDEYEISRDKCVRHTLEKLNKNISISYTQVKRYARDKNSIGRFDVAIALSKLGFSPDPMTAYGEYLDFGKTAYVTREKEQATSLIKKILTLGGIPVLVHPKSMKLGFQSQYYVMEELKNAGLCGIEAFNPHHTDEQTTFYTEMAEEFKLIPTVGSDYHGKSSDNIEIGLGINGNLKISDYSIITSLKQKKHELFLK